MVDSRVGTLRLFRGARRVLWYFLLSLRLVAEQGREGWRAERWRGSRGRLGRWRRCVFLFLASPAEVGNDTDGWMDGCDMRSL